MIKAKASKIMRNYEKKICIVNNGQGLIFISNIQFFLCMCYNSSKISNEKSKHFAKLHLPLFFVKINNNDSNNNNNMKIYIFFSNGKKKI
jgi:hypothetical protein